jgi:integrator complex subunit 6
VRANFLLTTLTGTRLQDDDQLHSIPVQQMGNYQEYLKKQPSPLRELETAPVRQHMFGNPFKVNKNLMIDEADEAMPGQQSSRRRSASTVSLDSLPPSPSPKKRKPGPLPKDTPYRRPATPPPGGISELESPPNSPDTAHIENNGCQEDHELEIDLTDHEESSSDSDSVLGGEHDEPAITMNHVNNHIGESEELSNHVGHDRPKDPMRESIEIGALDNGIEEPRQITNNNIILSPADREYNNKIKEVILKQVKRPGKNYDNLFSQMDSMHGNLEIKSLFVKGIIHEALRFKRKTLAHRLEQYEQSLFKMDITNHQQSPSR